MSEIVSQNTLWDETPLKHCPQCNKDLPATSEFFHKSSASKDGLNRLCKPCNRIHSSAYHERKRIENNGANPFDPRAVKVCSKCKQAKPKTEEHFSRCIGTKDGLTYICNICNNAKVHQYRRDNLEKVRAADRARRPRKRPIDTKELKYCSKCCEMKPRTEEFFHKNHHTKDGFCNFCKVCNNKKNALYKAKKRENNPTKPKATHCPKGHPLVEGNLRRGRRECLICHRTNARLRALKKRKNNPVKRVAGYCVHGHPLVKGNLRTGKHAGSCLTCHRESGKRRYHKDPKKMVAQATAYSKAHRAQINERMKKYRQQESWKARAKASSLRRRARKLSAGKVSLPNPRLYDDELSRIHLELLHKDLCCYCGKPMEHIDHIVPIAKNGEEHWSNLTAACQRCNNRKIDKSLLEFLMYRLEYPDPPEEGD